MMASHAYAVSANCCASGGAERSALYGGRSRSRPQIRRQLAPAAVAPSSTAARAARLVEPTRSEPPTPTMCGELNKMSPAIAALPDDSPRWRLGPSHRRYLAEPCPGRDCRASPTRVVQTMHRRAAKASGYGMTDRIEDAESRRAEEA